MTSSVVTVSGTSLMIEHKAETGAEYTRESTYGVGPFSPSSESTQAQVDRVRSASEQMM